MGCFGTATKKKGDADAAPDAGADKPKKKVAKLRGVGLPILADLVEDEVRVRLLGVMLIVTLYLAFAFTARRGGREGGMGEGREEWDRQAPHRRRRRIYIFTQEERRRRISIPRPCRRRDTYFHSRPVCL